MIVEIRYSVQSYAIFWVTLVVTSKNNSRIGPSVKKRKLPLCLFCFRARMKQTEMKLQSKLDPFFCIVVNGPKDRPCSLL